MKSTQLFSIALAVFIIAACADTTPTRYTPEPEPLENIIKESPTGFVQGFETEFIDEEDFIEIGEMI